MELNLKGKNALVCGSTQGIGKSTATALALEGVNVTLVARNEEKLKQVLQELPNTNKHSYIVADFSFPDDLNSKVISFIKEQHGFHILVNNTGGPKGGNILEATIPEFEQAFTQHIKCNHLLAQTVIPFMKTEGFGRIINIVSTSVKEPIPGLGVSNTIRAAVGNWAKTLATEVGALGITVNNVLPGFTDTERIAEITKANAKKEGISFDEMSQIMKSHAPAKRFAKPEEIANAVVFLASEAAAYITGINLPVDGGRTKSL
ncbi:SDR family oxidoreductase [Flavobacteriaceae bacterium XHP0103]|uniref:SDR family oxidoreductase n=1 Tax=Marixanthotalea marina TaxID=2844359 RepID=UPI002989AF2C|nr:SDR family oxidoreductase [Marixanthotalea marina]MBU3821906.1 SDR family oxidoreductase [Marixanthotalea marina]